MGTGIGGLITLEEQIEVYANKGAGRVSPFFVPMMMANATAGTIAMQFGWTGPNLCIATACAASAHAIGEAARLIRDGVCRRGDDRRLGIVHDTDRDLGVRAHDRIEHPQRRPRARVAAVRRRPRRVRHGRRRRRARARTLGPRGRARRPHLRRGRRLRPQRRRVPHHRAVTGRRRRGRVHAARARRRRA